MTFEVGIFYIIETEQVNESVDSYAEDVPRKIPQIEKPPSTTCRRAVSPGINECG